MLAVEGGRDGCVDGIGMVWASAPGAGVVGVISGMAACGVRVVSGADVSEQGEGDADRRSFAAGRSPSQKT